VYNARPDAGAGGSTYDLGREDKSDWRSKKKRDPRRWRFWVIVAFFAVIIAAIVCGVLFGVVFKNRIDTSTKAVDPDANSADLDINSDEIKKLLNNSDLHKVFPGIDYTPLNTQYPDCLDNPPSQNNITRDVAVLSQLTNTIRLYGTDCNQTQMTLHALDKLGMSDDIKVWLGVWQDNNATTNARQLSQMWDILKEYGDTPFKGLIVANEILFREQMTVTELGDLLSEVRTNLTAMNLSLPVATSDLGDKWTSELAAQSDYVMANIHPFFGGINANDAAAWTYSFWENNNGAYFKSDTSKNVISETGWPSQGGTDCGSDTVTDCPDASVAGIDELNQFMEDWVCQALSNGTNYFWFEAFDEPWKISFDTKTEKWEDHWGLMDVNRNLKTGVKIPDCGGKTI
jgi:exo-beta-1,3-glucanase (GH17 family)